MNGIKSTNGIDSMKVVSRTNSTTSMDWANVDLVRSKKSMNRMNSMSSITSVISMSSMNSMNSVTVIVKLFFCDKLLG